LTYTAENVSSLIDSATLDAFMIASAIEEPQALPAIQGDAAGKISLYFRWLYIFF